MSDSKSFNSLLDLVDSHLSKCSVGATPSDSIKGPLSKPIMIPSVNGVHKGLSDTRVIPPGERLFITKYSISDSPIQNVLAEQISNMLRVKKRKEQEERQSLEKGMNRLDIKEDNDNEYVIDLLKAIQPPAARPKPAQEILSSSSSFESLLLENTKHFEEECESPETNKFKMEDKLPSALPCGTDISYILVKNATKVKCSPFGKVLTARLKPVPAPYLKVKIKPKKIVRFDFNAKSPCDMIKEKLRKPTSYNTGYPNIMDIVMGEICQ